MSMKIYTKTGDKGNTSLLGGTKVPKSHSRIEAYGNVDELNSFIGWLGDQPGNEGIRQVFREIQDRLFTMGSMLAMEPDKRPGFTIPALYEKDVTLLEEEIDSMNAQLPEMKSFVLPGGHPLVSMAHICRSVCRRAERSIVFLREQGSAVDPLVLKYINRLSDYLFVLARFLAMRLQAEETKWKPRTD